MTVFLEIETPLFYSTRGVSGRMMPEPLAHQWPEVYDNTQAVIVPEPHSGEGQNTLGVRSGHEPGACCPAGVCEWLNGPVPGQMSTHAMPWRDRL